MMLFIEFCFTDFNEDIYSGMDSEAWEIILDTREMRHLLLMRMHFAGTLLLQLEMKDLVLCLPT